MADSPQEDIYSLGKAKELFNDLYDKRVHRSKDLPNDKYAWHLGEAIRHIDGAKGEREAEEKKEQRGNVNSDIFSGSV